MAGPRLDFGRSVLDLDPARRATAEHKVGNFMRNKRRVKDAVSLRPEHPIAASVEVAPVIERHPDEVIRRGLRRH